MRLLELGADGAGRIVAVVRVVDVLLCEEGDDDEGEEEVVALSSLRFWSNFLGAIRRRTFSPMPTAVAIQRPMMATAKPTCTTHRQIFTTSGGC